MSAIPIQNLYYLLSYAWDLLSERERALASIDKSRTATDMLALLLAAGIESLGKRGLFQDYQTRVEATSRLKGRVDFVASVRKLHHRQATMVCHFDELGSDNLVNGILRTTLDRLLSSDSIADKTKHRLWEVVPIVKNIPAIILRRGCFQRAMVTRQHLAYRMVLRVCELLFELAQPDSSGKTYQFADPWSDKGMPRLFETFVRNFLTKHLPKATVKARPLTWAAQGDSTEAEALLPLMKTDVTVEWEDRRCMVLDCKFYKDSFSRSPYGTKLHAQHLYQIAAYLHHHPWRILGASICGVLLYPTVETDFLHQYSFMGHRLTVASLDLNQPWKNIHDRLLKVVDTAVDGNMSGGALMSQLDAEIASLENRLAVARVCKNNIMREVP